VRIAVSADESPDWAWPSEPPPATWPTAATSTDESDTRNIAHIGEFDARP